MLATRAARPARPDETERRAIVAACEAFIGDVLKPRFLQRYRSGMAHNSGQAFDAPFARIDRMAKDCFDIYWMRHTGKWWRLHTGVTLVEALRILETDQVLYPF